ncbi:type II toxin-antitoxin system RelE/ParE family toxin [Chlamydiales bacterium]|nr:type II toxin-antitoxin system RelE/ParE family toxin [Chlamydiales bacterium]
MFKIEISPTAEKEIKSLPKREQTKIIKRIFKLSDDPKPAGVKKLKGMDSLFRVRQGNWRIIYTIENRKLHVLVLKVGQRKNVYKLK